MRELLEACGRREEVQEGDKGGLVASASGKQHGTVPARVTGDGEPVVVVVAADTTHGRNTMMSGGVLPNPHPYAVAVNESDQWPLWYIHHLLLPCLAPTVP